MTLLDLVVAVAESARSDAEVVATVTHMINCGRVRLVGCFRDADVRVTQDEAPRTQDLRPAR